MKKTLSAPLLAILGYCITIGAMAFEMHRRSNEWAERQIRCLDLLDEAREKAAIVERFIAQHPNPSRSIPLEEEYDQAIRRIAYIMHQHGIKETVVPYHLPQPTRTGWISFGFDPKRPDKVTISIPDEP